MATSISSHFPNTTKHRFAPQKQAIILWPPQEADGEEPQTDGEETQDQITPEACKISILHQPIEVRQVVPLAGDTCSDWDSDETSLNLDSDETSLDMDYFLTKTDTILVEESYSEITVTRSNEFHSKKKFEKKYDPNQDCVLQSLLNWFCQKLLICTSSDLK